MTVITTYRGDMWTESFDFYAKPTNPPLEDGDGTFIGNVAIEPQDASTSLTWDPPDDRTWYYRVIPIRRRIAGPGINL